MSTYANLKETLLLAFLTQNIQWGMDRYLHAAFQEYNRNVFEFIIKKLEMVNKLNIVMSQNKK